MLLTITTTKSPGHRPRLLLHKHPAAAVVRAVLRQGARLLPRGGTRPLHRRAAARRRPGGAGARPPRCHRRGWDARPVRQRPALRRLVVPSVAIAQVFGTALGGRCKERPELARPATAAGGAARRAALPRRRGASCARLFEPLGYAVDAEHHPLDERFPDWGESRYFTVTSAQRPSPVGPADAPLRADPGARRRQALLGRRRRGGEAAAARRGLARSAPRAGDDRPPLPAGITEPGRERRWRGSPRKRRRARRGDRSRERGAGGGASERPLSLQRAAARAVVAAALKASGAKRVLDLGCGEGKLLRRLLKDQAVRGDRRHGRVATALGDRRRAAEPRHAAAEAAASGSS